MPRVHSFFGGAAGHISRLTRDHDALLVCRLVGISTFTWYKQTWPRAGKDHEYGHRLARALADLIPLQAGKLSAYFPGELEV